MLVRDIHVQEAKIVHKENIRLSRVTNSKCILTPTNLLLVMCSRRCIHANSGINESEGTVCIHLGGLGAC